jgi:hypothetical protein
MAFSNLINFFRVPLKLLARTPGSTRTLGWETLTRISHASCETTQKNLERE